MYKLMNCSSILIANSTLLDNKVSMENFRKLKMQEENLETLKAAIDIILKIDEKISLMDKDFSLEAILDNVDEHGIKTYPLIKALEERIKEILTKISDITSEEFVNKKKEFNLAKGTIEVLESCEVDIVVEYEIDDSTALEERYAIQKIEDDYSNGKIGSFKREELLLDFIERGVLKRVEKRDVEIDSYGEVTKTTFNDCDLDFDILEFNVDKDGKPIFGEKDEEEEEE